MNRKTISGDDVSSELISNLLRRSLFRPESAIGACPEERTYADLMGGTLAEEERARTLGHLAKCQKCLDLVACLVEVEAQPQDHTPDELLAAAMKLGTEQKSVPIFSRYQWQTSLAAAAGIVLLVSVLVTQYPQSDNGISGGEQSSSTQTETESVRLKRQDGDGLSMLFPADGAVIEPSQTEFRWSGVDRSLYYEIQVLSESGDIVWEGRTEDTRMQLPTGIELEPEQGYFVWVRVYLPDGKTIKSKAVAIRVD
jgi:hypothetical protein